MILIDGFAIDIATTEEHQLDSEVTEYPVEEGSDIADHVRARPIMVSLDCIVSNTPIGPIADTRRAEGSVSDSELLAPSSPADDAYAKLVAIREAREPITITTSLKTYENMLLESLSIPRSARTGDALEFRASFKQLLLVTNRRTTIRTKIPRAKKKVNRGHKPTEAVRTTATPPAVQAAPPPSPKTDTNTRRLVNAGPSRRVPIASGGSDVTPRRLPIASGGGGPRSQGRVPIAAGGG